MTIEGRQERDHSLDGTLADLILSGEFKILKNIFPRRRDRLQFYGKMISPVLRHPLRVTLLGFDDAEGKKIESAATKNLMEWTLDGDRCAPEYRERFETALGERALAEAG